MTASESQSGSVLDAAPAEDVAEESSRLDDVFGILQNRRRRRVLRYLEEEPSTTQGNLAEHIAAIENGVSRQELTSMQRKRVYISLYQSHLPKLDDSGAIDFDRNRGTVERTARTAEFLQYLDRVDEQPPNPTRRKAVHTLGTAVLFSVAVLASAVAQLGFGSGAVDVGAVAVLVGCVWAVAAVDVLR